MYFESHFLNAVAQRFEVSITKGRIIAVDFFFYQVKDIEKFFVIFQLLEPNKSMFYHVIPAVQRLVCKFIWHILNKTVP